MNKKTIEVEGATISEAIHKALNILNAKQKDVTIRVLKEEHKGLFGMEGAKLARIKATLKKSESASPGDSEKKKSKNSQ
ncbi:MAG: Jag N-terminal domain-containing protein [Candidatus Omnitrophota bacterium]